MANIQYIAILIISLAAIILNGILFLLVYANSRLRTRFNMTILNACLADVFVSVQFLSLTLYSLITARSPQGPTDCKVLGVLHLFGFVGSVTGIAAVSFFRFIIICRPDLNSRYFSKLGTLLFNSSVWIFSLLISCPPLLGWGNFFYHRGMSICFVEWNRSISYMIFMISLCFCGPIAITLLSLIFILKRKRTISFQSDINESSMTNNARIYAAEKRKKKQKVERKITQSILLVAMFFMLCWGPFVVLMLIEAFSHWKVSDWIHEAGIILGCFNSIANPVVYLVWNANFRNAVTCKLKRWCCNSVGRDDFCITSTS